jgi:hypothetical protein
MAWSKKADRGDAGHMPCYQQEVGSPPAYLTCDPQSRIFPVGWKDVWFRRCARRDSDGVVRYTCPICEKKFDHSLIDHLQGDHIWPYSLFGDTSWENYQLICGSCNATKKNRLDTDIREVLGAGEFRSIVACFLDKQVQAGLLTRDAVLSGILGHANFRK